MGRIVLSHTHHNGPCSVIIITRKVRAPSGRHPSICIAHIVRRTANVRDHSAILKCVRHKNGPSPFSHGLTAHLNKRTARLVTGERFKHVIYVGNDRIRSVPLSRITNGLGLMAPRRSLVVRKGQVKVSFKGWFSTKATSVLISTFLFSMSTVSYPLFSATSSNEFSGSFSTIFSPIFFFLDSRVGY